MNMCTSQTDTQEWLERDEQQELTGHGIITLVNWDDNEDEEDNDIGTGLGPDK
jgi:hypothetical protein